MPFPVLSQKLSKADALVFFDLEATEYHHEAIALSLFIYPKKPGELLPISDKPATSYKSLIRPKEKIGSRVKALTGLNDTQVKRDGKDYRQVVLEVSKLLRAYHYKRFICYGELDTRVLENTTDFHSETETNFYRNIKKNTFDFYRYLMDRIVDEKGQAYSISRLVTLYSLFVPGKPHDPSYDALALYEIYKHYVMNEEEDIQLYAKNFLKNPSSDTLSKKAVGRILKEGSLSKEDFYEMLRENL